MADLFDSPADRVIDREPHPSVRQKAASGELFARSTGPASRLSQRYSNANTRFQSFFMLITVQPFFFASS